MTTIATETKMEKTAESVQTGSSRADRLANRILLGAATLAAFAESLTDAEWTLSVTASDKRTIGTIVHHVASMYPAETTAAQAIASGVAVMEITWDVVTKLNADHAAENTKVDKRTALDLLRRNSAASAEAIRKLTDEQLDTAAPFGLSYGAPVTAQFVVEDHALRHSWHHLAKIKLAVGR